MYSNIFNLSPKLDNQTKYLLSQQKQILIVGSIRFSKMYSSSSKYEQIIKDIKLMRKGSENVVGKSITSANHEIVIKYLYQIVKKDFCFYRDLQLMVNFILDLKRFMLNLIV